MGLVLSVQFQNATLARYPQAVTEIAVLALAHGIFGFFMAGLQFMSQLANVFARSQPALIRVQIFVIAVGLILSLPILGLALTSTGHQLIQTAYGVDASLAWRVADYLLLMTPLLLFTAERHFFMGLLVQARLTGTVTILNLIYLTLVLAALITGFYLGLQPMYVIVGAEVIGVSSLVLLLGAAIRIRYRLPSLEEHQGVTYHELLRFFLPVSTTGVMFALSRPIIFAFATRATDSLLIVAALRVAFDFTMLFQQAANQFRHFFITFGVDDLATKRQFMTIIAVALTLLAATFALSPLSTLVWGQLMGLSAQLQELANQCVLILSLTPLVLVFRNYYHSQLMLLRRTTGMAWGSFLRVIVIAATCAVLFTTGTLTHTSAAACLLLGFVIEALYAVFAHRNAVRLV